MADVMNWLCCIRTEATLPSKPSGIGIALRSSNCKSDKFLALFLIDGDPISWLFSNYFSQIRFVLCLLHNLWPTGIDWCIIADHNIRFVRLINHWWILTVDLGTITEMLSIWDPIHALSESTFCIYFRWKKSDDNDFFCQIFVGNWFVAVAANTWIML